MARKAMLFAAFAVLFAAIAAPLAAQADYKMLDVTEDGRYYKNRFDVADWEPGEDFIYLRSYYIPWQGEDSIDYEMTLQQLKVNGEVVGVNLVGKKCEDVAGQAKIVTVQCTPQHLEDLDAFPKLVAVSLVGVKNEDDLSKLVELPNLRALDIAYCKVSDDGLKYVSLLPELRVLNLANTEISDAGLSYLSELKHLRTLDLESTEITDAGIAHLKDLGNLRSLNLFHTKAAGAETLALRGKPLKITDAGIKALAGMGKLSELNLHGAAITDEGVKELSKMTLQTMTHMRKLNLSATAVTDDCVPALAKMRELRNLDIKGTDISPDKVAELRMKLPDCEINY
ncbi:hypothetical protein KAX06_07805 [candidate division WOR-3 bacterium]|nr:hypothetical protein [candidate division WOR-3 bacterium]